MMPLHSIVEEVMKFYNLGDKAFETEFSMIYMKLAPLKQESSHCVRAWLNGNAMFYETLIEKKYTKRFLLICVTTKLNVSHSTSFNIIQH